MPSATITNLNSLKRKFPVNTIDELQEVNEILKNDDTLSEAIVHDWASEGGLSYKETTRKIMTKILTDNLAIGYSFVGHKGKISFKISYLSDLIIRSVKLADKAKLATSKDVEQYISIWLTKAPERLRKFKEKQNCIEN